MNKAKKHVVVNSSRRLCLCESQNHFCGTCLAFLLMCFVSSLKFICIAKNDL